MLNSDTLEIIFQSALKTQKKRKDFNLPFLAIKDHVLGKKYVLSLVFANKKTVTDLNKQYRDKDYTPNILSFPYSKNHGEIFIHLPTAKKQAPDFEMDFDTYLVFLFIHGCLHLKGMEHSSTMEELERKILQKMYSNKKIKNENTRKS